MKCFSKLEKKLFQIEIKFFKNPLLRLTPPLNALRLAVFLMTRLKTLNNEYIGRPK